MFQTKEKVIFSDDIIKVTTMRDVNGASVDYDSFILYTEEVTNILHDCNLNISCLKIYYHVCQNKKLITYIDSSDQYDWIEFVLAPVRGDPLVVLFKMEKNYKIYNYAKIFLDNVIKKAISNLRDIPSNRQTRMQFSSLKEDIVVFQESLQEFGKNVDQLKIQFVNQ